MSIAVGPRLSTTLRLDFPHMAALEIHMKSVIYNNYNPFREPLQIRFSESSTRDIPSFSIKYVDGFTKGLICQGIVGLIDCLDSLLHLLSHKGIELQILTKNSLLLTGLLSGNAN